MNYRHAFHAGNFADLVKHAGLLQLVRELTAMGGPLTVIDTHAGRGLYDLAGEDARRSGEAEAGVLRLMALSDPPRVLKGLTAAVAGLNDGGKIRRYPGSPWLIAETLRAQDSYIACELRPDEHEALRVVMRGRTNVRTFATDGYAAAVTHCTPRGRVLTLIDPPFERPDDYTQIVQTTAALRRRNPNAQALVWLPLKDLETFDGFLRDLEDSVDAPLQVAECRMRPLIDPMKMNGCALVAVGAPDLQAPLSEICAWVADTLGRGGSSRVYRVAA